MAYCPRSEDSLRRARFAARFGGHADVSTTVIYTHVLQRGACGVTSPLDRL